MAKTKPQPKKQPAKPSVPSDEPAVVPGSLDAREIITARDEITSLLGPLSDNDARSLTAILVRMSTHDRKEIARILTTNAG